MLLQNEEPLAIVPEESYTVPICSVASRCRLQGPAPHFIQHRMTQAYTSLAQSRERMTMHHLLLLTGLQLMHRHSLPALSQGGTSFGHHLAVGTIEP